MYQPLTALLQSHTLPQMSGDLDGELQAWGGRKGEAEAEMGKRHREELISNKTEIEGG